MILFKLFAAFFQIGLFSIGGGYAAMPLIQHQVIDVNGWLTMEAFADIMTISEMTPGPIVINAATFVGMQVSGFIGAIVATLGCVFPSFSIVLLLAHLYYKYKSLKVMQGILYGLRPCVLAMILSAGLSIFLLSVTGSSQINRGSEISIDYIALFLTIATFVLMRIKKTSPIASMLLSGLAGTILYLIF